ncbi:MAG: hypothetical protein R3B70_46630 [Polyangiaceae bacterium]
MHRLPIFAATTALLLAACDKTPEPSGSSPPPSTSASPSQTAKVTNPPKAGPGEIAWDTPAKWKEIPNPNAMRIATYLIARQEGDPDDAEMSVSRVGGSVEANIGRWKAQFSPPKPDSGKRFERDIAGLKVTIYEVSGTYTGMVIRGQTIQPRQDWALLAAIVEGSGGDPWFFKLTGPEKTVQAARADFDSLVNSFHPK